MVARSPRPWPIWPMHRSVPGSRSRIEIWVRSRSRRLRSRLHHWTPSKIFFICLPLCKFRCTDNWDRFIWDHSFDTTSFETTTFETC